MKKIAITQRLILNDSYYEVREALDVNWGRLFKELNYLPIVLPIEIDFENYFANIDIDGILLTGGNDLYSINNSELSKKRDNFELKLVEYGIKNNIPIFGVCRGMQLIAEYFGCTFKQIENHVAVKHKLIISQESKYRAYLKNLDKVNSYHNYGVLDTNNDLLVSARSEHNIIEAFEHKKYKIFAQMWHSERENPFVKNELDLIKEFFNFHIEDIKNIAKYAGKAIMKIYNSKFEVEHKEDDSPITRADLIANELIIKELAKISNYPIVTEERPIDYETRKNWKRFWLVDPLDGTKDFIAKNGEFSVNIALIENNKPIFGLVYVPVSQDIYYAYKDEGAFKNDVKIYNNSKRDSLIGSDSNFHSSDMTKEFFNKNNIKKINRFGSSIKICKLAEGEIDVYPRLNGTKEWDTAASHIIANEAGCKLIDIKTKKELVYNKKSMKNNYFIASRNDLEFEI